MNRRFGIGNALGLIFGLMFLPWAAAQQPAAPNELPPAESILDRSVEVTGGLAAYESRTSAVTTGTFEIAAANLTGQLRIIVKPGLQRTTIQLPGVGTIDGGVNNGVAWSSDPFAGPRILTGFEADLAVANAQPSGGARWREQYKAVETTGVEDVNGKPAYRVVHTLAKGGSMTGFYDVASGLLVKIEFATAQAPIAQLLEEYSDLGGVLTPTRVVTTMMGQRVSVIRLASVETNVEIPDEQFALPDAVQALVQ